VDGGRPASVTTPTRPLVLGEQAVQFGRGIHPATDTVCAGVDLDRKLMTHGAQDRSIWVRLVGSEAPTRVTTSA
jgi:hypothetical protein